MHGFVPGACVSAVDAQNFTELSTTVTQLRNINDSNWRH